LCVIDVAPVGRKVAASVFASVDRQLGRLASVAGEEPLPSTHVDDHTIGIHHNPPDVARQRRTQHVVLV